MQTDSRVTLCTPWRGCLSERILLTSWKANRFSASQEMLLYYGNIWLDKSPPPVPVLNQINPVHAAPLPLFHCLKIHFNIFLPSAPGFSKWSLPCKLFAPRRISLFESSTRNRQDKPPGEQNPPWERIYISSPASVSRCNSKKIARYG